MGPPLDSRRERFEAVWSRDHPAVLAYARRRTGPDLAEEVVAETFLVAWRRIDDLPAEALPWLYGVARRVLANQRRTAGRRTALAERLAAEGILTAPAGEARGLREALDTLSEADRELLMLLAWEGLEPGAAAIALGCSRATLAVRLHRARRRLARALDREARPSAHDELHMEEAR